MRRWIALGLSLAAPAGSAASAEPAPLQVAGLFGDGAVLQREAVLPVWGTAAPEADVTVAGADRRFVRARARIDGERVVVWSPEVAAPVAVRYAWADNPADANLYNRAGLPASPLRTDDWPGGSTEGDPEEQETDVGAESKEATEPPEPSQALARLTMG